MTRILAVEDDPYTRSLLEGLLRDRPLTVDFAVDGAAAKRLFRANDYNLILMDQRLPDANGLDLIREMRSERPNQVTLLMTGYADVRDAVRSVREGVFDYLAKPFENLEELETTIDKALELDRAYREIDTLRASLHKRNIGPALISRSAALERILALARQIAPLDTTVLIEGESGTGKELIAQLIHTLSGRASGRFLAVNCGALSESLLESTLFGYEKGAFTGAAKTTPGFFEEADKGTLFLDEIADMGTKLQSSLLRTIQEHSFTRLGSTRASFSDFRLICASNRHLTDLVQAGEFRSDLFYRINVITLTLPPLRERREDILPLAVHFLDHFNRSFNKSLGTFTPEAIALLEALPWPGNVRQLRNAVERVVALKTDGLVDATDLRQLLPESSVVEVATSLEYETAREHFELAYLRHLLAQCDGNVSEAARRSGIARQNLYVKMKRWGLVPRD